jgi:hypothetical protein
MSNPIKTTYRETEIIYLEDPNRWRFTANGRERSAESLVKAREAIDRALDEVREKKQKPWEPFEAYFAKGYRDEGFVRVRVTSVAEERSYSSEPKFWISKPDAKGKPERSKESASSLFKLCAENEALITEMGKLYAERERVDGAIRDARRQMVKIEIPKGD